MKVHVKWSKELFKDIEVDLEQPPLVFKSQLFALSGVPPDRQKVMVKGGLLKDDEWGKAVPKEGQTIMMMGTAEAIPTEIPKNIPVFVEDLPEKEQHYYGNKKFGRGLQNLGNTCYMNSTLQCLYKVPELRAALKSVTGASTSQATKLLLAARDLFNELDDGGEPTTPFRFLLSMRERFPQFSQTTNQGVPMQQDAEECWSQLLYTFRESLKAGDAPSPMEDMFGIGMRTKLVCDETKEEMEDEALNYALKCNISGDVNFLSQGIRLGLTEDREKNSEQLGRLALFKGSSVVTRLPQNLTVQMVRFFYKADVKQKAKILRKVTYPMELDMYEYCAPELQKQLEGPRAKAKEIEDRLVEERKTAKKLKGEDGSAAAPSTSGGDAEMKDAAASTSGPTAKTGKYELMGVLTHKGRSADSGHYVAWVKQDSGEWVLFDDEELHIKNDEEILALSGGGDWHMAYLLLYRAKIVPFVDGEVVKGLGVVAEEGAKAEAMETA